MLATEPLPESAAAQANIIANASVDSREARDLTEKLKL